MKGKSQNSVSILDTNPLFFKQHDGIFMPNLFDYVQVPSHGTDTTTVPHAVGFRVITNAELTSLLNQGQELLQTIPFEGSLLMVLTSAPLILIAQ